MRVMNVQNGNNNTLMQKKRMMRKIRECDFAIIETALFLDTHPNNLKALSYYSNLRSEREQLASEYEKNFGPITIKGNMNENKWDWISGPWPWEGEN